MSAVTKPYGLISSNSSHSFPQGCQGQGRSLQIWVSGKTLFLASTGLSACCVLHMAFVFIPVERGDFQCSFLKGPSPYLPDESLALINPPNRSHLSRGSDFNYSHLGAQDFSIRTVGNVTPFIINRFEQKRQWKDFTEREKKGKQTKILKDCRAPFRDCFITVSCFFHLSREGDWNAWVNYGSTLCKNYCKAFISMRYNQRTLCLVRTQ